MGSVSVRVNDGLRNLVGEVPAIAIILVAIVVIISVVVWDFVLVDPDVVDEVDEESLSSPSSHSLGNVVLR